MPDVTQMKAEVFLSYASKDNDSCDPTVKERAWVTEFHENLESKLHAICKREYFTKIFRDDRDRNGEIVLNDWLINALNDAKILISILTGNYEQSEWCQAEREFFLTKMLEGSSYNLLIEKVPYEERELFIYKFYNTNGRHYETFCVHNKTHEFSQKMMELAMDIRDTLKRKVEGKSRIYLSSSTADINIKYRKKIKSELERLGYIVVPEALSINTVEDFKQKISDALNDIHHAFLILGDKKTLSPKGTQKSSEELQFEMVFEHKDINKTIWYPDFYEDIDPQQMLFIERFTKDSSPNYVNQKFDLLKYSLVKFISELENKTKEPIQKVSDNALVVPIKEAFISISDENLQLSDEQQQIKSKLMSVGFKISYPLFKGTAEEIRMHRDKCIANANYMILWLTEDLSESIVTSLIGDLKRATNADDTKKVIYGQKNDSYGYTSFTDFTELIEYINVYA